MKNTNRLGKMPTWQKHFVQIAILSCSLTGLVYLLGHEFHIKRALLGTHSVLAWHGIAAVLASIALGSVLPFHLKAGLKSKRKFCVCAVVPLVVEYLPENHKEFK